MTIRSITLLGSSSGRNVGDATLITGIMEAINNACNADILYEIPTVRPSYIREHYAGYRVRPISMLPWHGSVKMLGLPTLRSILRTDMSLVFDAILFDRSLYNPLFNYMWTVSWLLPLAKRRGKATGFYNVGIGPVNTVAGRRILRQLSDTVDFITVRDVDSYRILQEIGACTDNIVVGADAALYVPRQDPQRGAALLQEIGLSPKEEILAVNINAYMDTWAGPDVKPMGKERFIQAYAEVLDRVQAATGVPILFVCTQTMDVAINKDVMERMTSGGPKVLLSNVNRGHLDIKAALGRVSMLFGMRLHSLILATSELTPVVGAAYQPKVRHYLRTLGLQDYCVGFEEFEPAQVATAVVNGWLDRVRQRQMLAERIPVLRERASIAAKLVAAVHRGEGIGPVVTRFATAAANRALIDDTPPMGNVSLEQEQAPTDYRSQENSRAQ